MRTTVFSISLCSLISAMISTRFVGQKVNAAQDGIITARELRIVDYWTGLHRALLAFRDLYNETWLIERHGFRPPAAIRTAQLPPAALAA